MASPTGSSVSANGSLPSQYNKPNDLLNGQDNSFSIQPKELRQPANSGISSPPEKDIDFSKVNIPDYNSVQAKRDALNANPKQVVEQAQAQKKVLDDQSAAIIKKQEDAFKKQHGDGFLGGVQLGMRYAASNVLKGASNIVPAAVYASDRINKMLTGQPLLSDDEKNELIDKTSKAANLGLNSDYNGSDKVMSAVGGLAQFLPAALTAEGTAGASFYLNGVGNAYKEVQEAKKHGATFSNGAEDMYIQGKGFADYILMSRLNAHSLYPTLPAELRNVASRDVSIEAMKSLIQSGEPITSESLASAFKDKAITMADNIKTKGVPFLKNLAKGYVKTTADLSALTTVDALLKKGSNALSGKENFNVPDGSVGDNIAHIATSDGPIFALMGAHENVGTLFDHSPQKNEVVESLKKDTSPEAINELKDSVQQQATERGWSESDLDGTLSHIDKIADAVKKVPKHLSDEKFNKALDIVLGKQNLSDQLAKSQEHNSTLDPAMAEVGTPEHQALTAKLEQSDDKLREIMTGKKNKYFEDEEKGGFFKQLGGDGKPEPISKERFDLEQIEKEGKDIAKESKSREELQTIADHSDEVEQQHRQMAEQETDPAEKAGMLEIADKAKEVGDKAKIHLNSESPSIPTDHIAVTEKESSNNKPNTDEDQQPLPTQENVVTETAVPPERTKEVLAKAEDDLEVLKKVGNKQLKHEASIKRLVDAKNKGEISEDEFNGLKERFDNVLSESTPMPKSENITPEQHAELNEHLKEDGLTTNDFIEHENNDTGEEAGPSADALPKSEDDPGRDAGEDTANTTSKDEKSASDTDVDESAVYGTKNAITEALRDGLGLPELTIPKDRSEDESLNAWKDGTRTPEDIIDGLLDPNKDIYDKSITPNDEPILREYIKGLTERTRELNKIRVHLEEKVAGGDEQATYDLASLRQQMANHYDKVENALNASRIGGNIWHKYGAERQLAIDEKGLVLNSIDRIKTMYGSDIPEKVKQELKDLQMKYDNLEAKNAEIEARLKDQTAQDVVNAAKPKKSILGRKVVKRTAEEFKAERASIIEDLKNDFKKSFGKATATILPGSEQLNAIAPHVIKLMRSFAEQGIDKLDDIITEIHDTIKDTVTGISKDDVKDIIAGKYGNKKPLSELNKRISELRTEARNKVRLEELESGIKAKTKARIENSPEIKSLQKQIRELESKNGLKDRIDKLKQGIESVAKKKGESSDEVKALQQELADLKTTKGLQEKIERLKQGIIDETKKVTEKSPEIVALQKQVADLKKQGLNEFVNASIQDLKKQTKTIQSQIDKGDFFKTPTVKRQWENDPEWIKHNKEKNKVKDRLRVLENEAFDSKKSKLMRAMDWTNRWGRRVIFFGANAVYTKLSSAAVLGSFLHREVEQGLGTINAKMFPNIARNAPIEGSFNATAEAKFYQEFLNPVKFAKNTYDIAKTGETELSRELSSFKHRDHIPGLDLFAADTHIMIKDPVKRATFESSIIYHLDWYAKHGIDGTHPLLLESARQASYKRAEYEIFQNTDKNGNVVSRFFNELEKAGVEERNSGLGLAKLKGNTKYAAAALYHFFIPINTVPLNILNRIGLGLRLPYTIMDAMAKNKDIREGILNMTNEESDLIMRQLKKGQVGAAYWTLGFVLGGSIAGGLYTGFNPDKKRKSTDANHDELKVGSLEVPKNVQHNYQLQSLQMGATWKNVYSHYINDNGHSQLSAIAGATAATAGATLEQIPSVNFASKAIEATQGERGGVKFVKDLKRRVGIGKAMSVLQMMGLW